VEDLEKKIGKSLKKMRDCGAFGRVIMSTIIVSHLRERERGLLVC
jgi:hypothetical protein